MVFIIVLASVLAFNAVRFDRNIGSARLPEAAVAADEEKARRALASTTRFGLTRGSLAATTRKVPGGAGMVASDSVSSLSGIGGSGPGGHHTDAELGMDAPSPTVPADRRGSAALPPPVTVLPHAEGAGAVGASTGAGTGHHVSLAIRAAGDDGATPSPAAGSAAEGPLSPISPPVATPAPLTPAASLAVSAAAAAEAAAAHALAFEPMTL
jgi:hypothetical protein